MKIALAQLNYHIGNFEENITRITRAIHEAREMGADLVVFAELAVCGYPPRDFLEWDEFIDRCEASVEAIAAVCKGIAAIVGAPARNPVPEGKNLYNSAYFLEDGAVKARVDKSLLPTYDVFDEYRYFEHNRSHSVIEFKGQRIALTICEDLWNSDEDPMYVASPMDELIRQKPSLMINIAASPFDYVHREARIAVLRANCRKYHLPLLYVNHTGSQTELIFDGGSLAFDRQGNLLGELKYFKEDLQLFEINETAAQEENSPPAFDLTPAAGSPASSAAERTPEQLAAVYAPALPSSYDDSISATAISRIHQALLTGIRDYFRKSGFDKAILGMSGGIDSALVLALACEALGKENVLAVLMPSGFSSEHSVSDSLEMISLLGCRHELIPIANVYECFLSELKPQFRDLPFGLAEENLQARVRGTLLMALSNKFGYILLNTSNKSENAVGYGTLYGDMCGGLSVIGDVYKMQVYALARYLNEKAARIPVNIIAKAPSAELRPNQKDSDSLPDYALLDKVLFQYIEGKKTTAEIVQQGFEADTVERIIRMVNLNEYKRYQVPPILRVSPKAFGMGRRMPIVGKYLS
ncbi:NAD+ synthase (glutamine-hydrolysing) [Anseongella ginsenosidimutans]|uniref:Glutamine-dependent NAD(+) synthetase n=1 Tax=Anseongella ginsenosidimutans TaxID=496056 RepID=A0A4R3KWW5_9SPHI|nr:NAD+ synthase [Anseongella ginsenosidimutans]QEC51192.1 NAD+ synthase [Anseongella ginsenosidimutans]TCS90135.1 NAD+ synthase (glutamine-hydrolysing) [Anseongella ginsenosidimutans]